MKDMCRIFYSVYTSELIFIIASFQVLKAQATVNRTNNVVANAAFKSQTKREFINLKEMSVKPAPGESLVSVNFILNYSCEI